jgi:hypothetical protein
MPGGDAVALRDAFGRGDDRAHARIGAQPEVIAERIELQVLRVDHGEIGLADRDLLAGDGGVDHRSQRDEVLGVGLE